MDLKTLNRVIDQIADEKGLDKEDVIKVVETSLAAAYKREYRKKEEIVKAKIDLKTGKTDFWLVKLVVDKDMVRTKEEEKDENNPKPLFNPYRHLQIEEAKKIKPDVKPGDELEFPLEEKEEFGRIAAQTAKQVILQKIREAEKESIKKEFQDKEGGIVSGIIQRIERGNVYVNLGRALGVMFFNEAMPNEFYRPGQRLRFYLLAVQEETAKTPGLVLSRAHPDFVKKLFEMEVPEIAEGVVEVKAVAREPGSRTKIAVFSKMEGVDPIGSCIGQRGTRVMAITNELGNEKIDIIEYSEDPEKFIASALSPAQVKTVEILPKREAKVLVAEDQLSLAIGKGGQNVRLAAKLTGWKIDVRSIDRPDELISDEGLKEQKNQEQENKQNRQNEKKENKQNEKEASKN